MPNSQKTATANDAPLCPTCGRKPKAKRKPLSKEKNAQLAAAFRKRNRDTQRCIECGDERKPGSQYCPAHLQAGKARANDTRERRKAAGLTVRGTVPKRTPRAL